MTFECLDTSGSPGAPGLPGYTGATGAPGGAGPPGRGARIIEVPAAVAADLSGCVGPRGKYFLSVQLFVSKVADKFPKN